jgi:hypothetical protein
VDTSGSLNSTERTKLQSGVNEFIDALPTDGSVLVGTVEFGGSSVKSKTDLANPGSVSFAISSSGGNTPMPAALDIADQAVYSDAAARSGAQKLVVMFTDGGPNYSNTAYSVGGLTAPRDPSGDWSTTSGDGTYDGADTASATVSEGEMDETALVAASVKSGSVGGGGTRIVTVYVGDADTQAMTAGAIGTYTDLPSFLADEVASDADSAFDVDIDDLGTVADEIVTAVTASCEDCVDCSAAGELVRYEWDEEEGAFVPEGEEDAGVSLVGGDPDEVCFEVAYCDAYAVVKAGQAYEITAVEENEDGEVCVEALDNPNGAEGNTYGVSFVAFYCEEPDAENVPGLQGTGNGPSGGAGGPGGRGGRGR